MYKMNYTYRFRLNPNNSQQKRLNIQFGIMRWTYNHFLSRRKELYLKSKEENLKLARPLNYNADCAELTQLKKQEEYKWLKQGIAQSMQNSLKHLESAFGNFFEKRSEYPKFKCRGKSKNSLHIPNKETFTIGNNKLYIPKFLEGIEIVLKSATLNQGSDKDYYVTFLVEREIFDPLPLNDKSVGIDLGLKSFIVTSDGLKINSPKIYRKYEKRLAKYQQSLSRKKKGSNKREKAKIKVAKVHSKIKNSRNDFLHKEAIKLIRENQTIIFENLNVKGMVQNHKLAKSISDASWSTFIKFVEYKAEWYGREVIKIDRFFPSSKTCFSCAYVNQDLTLDQRDWLCPNCNKIIDRDLNAAKNNLQQGLNLKTVGPRC